MKHLYRFVRWFALLLWSLARWLPKFALCMAWDHDRASFKPPHSELDGWLIDCPRCGVPVSSRYEDRKRR